MRKVLGVGLAIMDHLVLAPDFPSKEGHLYCLDYRVDGGGMVGTAMCAAARLGGRVAVWCRVGDDIPGRQVLADLSARGIDVSACQVEPAGKTGVCTVIVKAPTGERTFLYRRAEHGPEPTPLPDLSGVDDAAVVLVDGHWREAALAAMRRARLQGIPVVADLNPRVPDPQALLDLADMPILPVQSALLFCDTDDPEEAACRLGERGAKVAVVTRGPEGGVYWLDGRTYRYPAVSVPVVDTTGAGDCFHGAFCYALAEGQDAHHAIRFAAAAAALNCRSLGGRAGLPTRDEVLALLG